MATPKKFWRVKPIWPNLWVQWYSSTGTFQALVFTYNVGPIVKILANNIPGPLYICFHFKVSHRNWFLKMGAGYLSWPFYFLKNDVEICIFFSQNFFCWKMLVSDWKSSEDWKTLQGGPKKNGFYANFSENFFRKIFLPKQSI